MKLKKKGVKLMNNLNSFIMDGRLAQDPEFIELDNSKTCCKFSVAINSSYKDANKQVKEEVVFIPVEVWGGLSAQCNKYLKKGDSVRVAGRLKEDKWQDNSGAKHSKIYVVAERVDFLSKKRKEEVITIDIEKGTTTVKEAVI